MYCDCQDPDTGSWCSNPSVSYFAASDNAIEDGTRLAVVLRQHQSWIGGGDIGTAWRDFRYYIEVWINGRPFADSCTVARRHRRSRLELVNGSHQAGTRGTLRRRVDRPKDLAPVMKPAPPIDNDACTLIAGHCHATGLPPDRCPHRAAESYREEPCSCPAIVMLPVYRWELLQVDCADLRRPLAPATFCGECAHRSVWKCRP